MLSIIKTGFVQVACLLASYFSRSCFELLLSVPESELPHEVWLEFHQSIQVSALDFFFFPILHIFKYIFSFLKKSSFSLCSGLVVYLILGRSSYSMLYILIQFSMWSQMWVEMCWGRAAVRTHCYLVVWVAGCHQLRDSSVLRSTTSAHPSW